MAVRLKSIHCDSKAAVRRNVAVLLLLWCLALGQHVTWAAHGNTGQRFREISQVPTRGFRDLNPNGDIERIREVNSRISQLLQTQEALVESLRPENQEKMQVYRNTNGQPVVARTPDEISVLSGFQRFSSEQVRQIIRAIGRELRHLENTLDSLSKNSNSLRTPSTNTRMTFHEENVRMDPSLASPFQNENRVVNIDLESSNGFSWLGNERSSTNNQQSFDRNQPSDNQVQLGSGNSPWELDMEIGGRGHERPPLPAGSNGHTVLRVTSRIQRPRVLEPLTNDILSASSMMQSERNSDDQTEGKLPETDSDFSHSQHPGAQSMSNSHSPNRGQRQNVVASNFVTQRSSVQLPNQMENGQQSNLGRSHDQFNEHMQRASRGRTQDVPISPEFSPFSEVRQNFQEQGVQVSRISRQFSQSQSANTRTQSSPFSRPARRHQQTEVTPSRLGIQTGSHHSSNQRPQHTSSNTMLNSQDPNARFTGTEERHSVHEGRNLPSNSLPGNSQIGAPTGNMMANNEIRTRELPDIWQSRSITRDRPTQSRNSNHPMTSAQFQRNSNNNNNNNNNNRNMNNNRNHHVSRNTNTMRHNSNNNLQNSNSFRGNQRIATSDRHPNIRGRFSPSGIVPQFTPINTHPHDSTSSSTASSSFRNSGSQGSFANRPFRAMSNFEATQTRQERLSGFSQQSQDTNINFQNGNIPRTSSFLSERNHNLHSGNRQNAFRYNPMEGPHGSQRQASTSQSQPEMREARVMNAGASRLGMARPNNPRANREQATDQNQNTNTETPEERRARHIQELRKRIRTKDDLRKFLRRLAYLRKMRANKNQNTGKNNEMVRFKRSTFEPSFTSTPSSYRHVVLQLTTRGATKIKSTAGTTPLTTSTGGTTPAPTLYSKTTTSTTTATTPVKTTTTTTPVKTTTTTPVTTTTKVTTTTTKPTTSTPITTTVATTTTPTTTKAPEINPYEIMPNVHENEDRILRETLELALLHSELGDSLPMDVIEGAIMEKLDRFKKEAIESPTDQIKKRGDVPITNTTSEPPHTKHDKESSAKNSSKLDSESKPRQITNEQKNSTNGNANSDTPVVDDKNKNSLESNKTEQILNLQNQLHKMKMQQLHFIKMNLLREQAIRQQKEQQQKERLHQQQLLREHALKMELEKQRKLQEIQQQQLLQQQMLQQQQLAWMALGPERRQEMVYGDTTDPPEPVVHKKVEIQVEKGPNKHEIEITKQQTHFSGATHVDPTIPAIVSGLTDSNGYHLIQEPLTEKLPDVQNINMPMLPSAQTTTKPLDEQIFHTTQPQIHFAEKQYEITTSHTVNHQRQTNSEVPGHDKLKNIFKQMQQLNQKEGQQQEKNHHENHLEVHQKAMLSSFQQDKQHNQQHRKVTIPKIQREPFHLQQHILEQNHQHGNPQMVNQPTQRNSEGSGHDKLKNIFKQMKQLNQKENQQHKNENPNNHLEVHQKEMLSSFQQDKQHTQQLLEQQKQLQLEQQKQQLLEQQKQQQIQQQLEQQKQQQLEQQKQQQLEQQKQQQLEQQKQQQIQQLLEQQKQQQLEQQKQQQIQQLLEQQKQQQIRQQLEQQKQHQLEQQKQQQIEQQLEQQKQQQIQQQLEQQKQQQLEQQKQQQIQQQLEQQKQQQIQQLLEQQKQQQIQQQLKQTEQLKHFLQQQVQQQAQQELYNQHHFVQQEHQTPGQEQHQTLWKQDNNVVNMQEHVANVLKQSNKIPTQNDIPLPAIETLNPSYFPSYDSQVEITVSEPSPNNLPLDENISTQINHLHVETTPATHTIFTTEIPLHHGKIYEQNNQPVSVSNSPGVPFQYQNHEDVFKGDISNVLVQHVSDPIHYANVDQNQNKNMDHEGVSEYLPPPVMNTIQTQNMLIPRGDIPVTIENQQLSVQQPQEQNQQLNQNHEQLKQQINQGQLKQALEQQIHTELQHIKQKEPLQQPPIHPNEPHVPQNTDMSMVNVHEEIPNVGDVAQVKQATTTSPIISTKPVQSVNIGSNNKELPHGHKMFNPIQNVVLWNPTQIELGNLEPETKVAKTVGIPISFESNAVDPKGAHSVQPRSKADARKRILDAQEQIEKTKLQENEPLPPSSNKLNGTAQSLFETIQAALGGKQMNLLNQLKAALLNPETPPTEIKRTEVRSMPLPTHPPTTPSTTTMAAVPSLVPHMLQSVFPTAFTGNSISSPNFFPPSNIQPFNQHILAQTPTVSQADVNSATLNAQHGDLFNLNNPTMAQMHGSNIIGTESVTKPTTSAPFVSMDPHVLQTVIMSMIQGEMTQNSQGNDVVKPEPTPTASVNVGAQLFSNALPVHDVPVHQPQLPLFSNTQVDHSPLLGSAGQCLVKYQCEGLGPFVGNVAVVSWCEASCENSSCPSNVCSCTKVCEPEHTPIVTNTGAHARVQGLNNMANEPQNQTDAEVGLLLSALAELDNLEKAGVKSVPQNILPPHIANLINRNVNNPNEINNRNSGIRNLPGGMMGFPGINRVNALNQNRQPMSNNHVFPTKANPTVQSPASEPNSLFRSIENLIDMKLRQVIPPNSMRFHLTTTTPATTTTEEVESEDQVTPEPRGNNRYPYYNQPHRWDAPPPRFSEFRDPRYPHDPRYDNWPGPPQKWNSPRENGRPTGPPSYEYTTPPTWGRPPANWGGWGGTRNPRDVQRPWNGEEFQRRSRRFARDPWRRHRVGRTNHGGEGGGEEAND